LPAMALQIDFARQYCEIPLFALAGDAIMNGKVVVVTGASGALGKVVAEVALARGARVAGIDHAASQMQASSSRIEFGSVDLSDPAEAKQAIDAAAKVIFE